MGTIVFLVIVAFLLLPEFLHGWGDDSWSCTGDGGDCPRSDHWH
jgi:hypothetical protein